MTHDHDCVYPILFIMGLISHSDAREMGNRALGFLATPTLSSMKKPWNLMIGYSFAYCWFRWGMMGFDGRDGRSARLLKKEMKQQHTASVNEHLTRSLVHMQPLSRLVRPQTDQVRGLEGGWDLPSFHPSTPSGTGLLTRSASHGNLQSNCGNHRQPQVRWTQHVFLILMLRSWKRWGMRYAQDQAAQRSKYTWQNQPSCLWYLKWRYCTDLHFWYLNFLVDLFLHVVICNDYDAL